MKTNKAKYVIGNWKMEPRTAIEAETIFEKIQSGIPRSSEALAVICPPSIFLGDIESIHRSRKISIGAQDVFWEESGPYTGEISAEQLKDSDVSYVIVGHSERRALGETNEIVASKLRTVLGAKMTPILCVGEEERDNSGNYFSYIREELESAMRDVPRSRVKGVVIAYEPIWAIGRGNNSIRPHDMHEMSIFIKKVLVGMFDKKIAASASVLYGGSVERDNAEALIKGGDISGFLLGHASLNAGHFLDILDIVNKTNA